jgi:hypothetical protein
MHAQDAAATSLRRSAWRGASVSDATTATPGSERKPSPSPARHAGVLFFKSLGEAAARDTAPTLAELLKNANAVLVVLSSAKDVELNRLAKNHECFAATIAGTKTGSLSSRANTASLSLSSGKEHQDSAQTVARLWRLII